MVTPGYWNRADVSAAVLAQGWLHSGDIASCDENGFLTIHGRIKDMINRGGEKVYALDVERPLGEHPAVLETAVYGIANAVWGEEVACAISFRPGMTATVDELNAWLRPRVARFKIPTAYRIWRELPRNPNGKIDKRRLQQEHDRMPELVP
jgi:acyl-CoA synthetase (AMP-forming)/AMP-acid ligase II